MGACPHDSTLAAVAAGELPRSTLARLQIHLDACEQCFEIVAATAAALSVNEPGASPRSLSRQTPPAQLMSDQGDDAGVQAFSPLSTTALSAPGDVIAHKYRLLAPIARGGCGEVWRAEHIEWRAPVAVKILMPSPEGQAEAQARFEREVRLAASLRSPHVVQILDHGTDAATGEPFLVMELLRGETLDGRLRRTGRMSLDETLRVLTQVGRALSLAHDSGVVHRDLKPSNIFLIADGDEQLVKVLDFGIAKPLRPSALASAITQPGTVLGTPSYMSPEQARGSSTVDHRADIWSLAVIACECLTGRKPFNGRDFAEIAARLLDARNRPVPSTLGAVPIGFDVWFAPCDAPGALGTLSVRQGAPRWLVDSGEPGPIG